MINKFFTIFCTLLAAALMVGSVTAAAATDLNYNTISSKKCCAVTEEFNVKSAAATLDTACNELDTNRFGSTAFSVDRIICSASDSIRAADSIRDGFNRGFGADDSTVDSRIRSADFAGTIRVL